MRSLDIAVVATLLDTAGTTRAQSGLGDPVYARDEIRRRVRLISFALQVCDR